MGATLSGWCSTTSYEPLEAQLNTAARPERSSSTSTRNNPVHEQLLTHRHTKRPIQYREFSTLPLRVSSGIPSLSSAMSAASTRTPQQHRSTLPPRPASQPSTPRASAPAISLLAPIQTPPSPSPTPSSTHILYLVVVSLSSRLYDLSEPHIAAIILRFRQVIHPIIMATSRGFNPLSVSFDEHHLFVLFSEDSPLAAVQTACMIREVILYYNLNLKGDEKKFGIPLGLIRVMDGEYLVYDGHNDKLFGDFVARSLVFGKGIQEVNDGDIIMSRYVKLACEASNDIFNSKIEFDEFELAMEEEKEKASTPTKPNSENGVQSSMSGTGSSTTFHEIAFVYRMRGDLIEFLRSRDEFWPPRIVRTNDEQFSQDKRILRIVSQCDSRYDLSSEISAYFCSRFICVYFQMDIERIVNDEGPTSKADYELFHTIVSTGLYEIYTKHNVIYEFDLSGILFRVEDADKALQCTVAIREYVKDVLRTHFLLQHVSINMSPIGVHIGNVLIVPETSIVFGKPIFVTKFLVEEQGVQSSLICSEEFKQLCSLKHLSLPPVEKRLAGEWVKVHYV